MHHLLFGGTFDPIHHGHLITCRQAREVLNADSIILLPAHISPHKTTTAPATPGSHRLAMITLAITGQADFQVDARELARAGPSFTIDTIEALRSGCADRFTLLIGADQLPKLSTWHRIADLLEQVEIAVLGRPGADLESGLQAFRSTVSVEKANRIFPLDAPMIDISATDIRRRVAARLPISFLVPAGVEGYIAREGLYHVQS